MRAAAFYCGGHEPLFLAALAFSAGIIAANYLWRAPLIWLGAFALAALTAGLCFRRAPQAAWVLLLLAILPLGAFYLQARDASATVVPCDLSIFGSGDDSTEVTAHVVREGLLRDSPYGGKLQSLDVETEQLRNDNGTLTAPVGIRLSIFNKASDGDATPRVYCYGERLQFIARLRLPHNYRNPGAMDLAGYLASQGVRLTGSADAAGVTVLSGFAGTRLGRWRSNARRSVLGHIQRLWPDERGALLQAMLIGGRAFIGRDTRVQFQRTGTYHFLVISGLSVGILALALFWGLRQLPISDAWATVLTIIATWGYAFLADLGSPVVRATVTLNVYLLARLLYRERATLNALGIAALGMLLVNPRTLFEPSFQLTFLSVIGVAGVAAPILMRTLQPVQIALRSLDAPRLDFEQSAWLAVCRVELALVRDYLAMMTGKRVANLLMRAARLPVAAAEMLFVSVVIQLAMALPMAWYFHRATSMALPANALALPIAGFLLPSAALTVACSYLWWAPAHLLALFTTPLLDWLTGAIRLVGHWRIADVRVANPSLAASWLAVAAVAAALVLARRRAWLAAMGLAGLLVSALGIVLLPPKMQWHPGVLEVTAIDVGQGDSLLLVTPRGETLLMDSGGMPAYLHSDFDVGEGVVSPYLWSRGITHLDAVASSHPHEDHLGGMPSVIANFRPTEFWYGLESPAPMFVEVEKTAQNYGVSLRRLQRDDSFDFDGVQVRVLNPQPGWPARDPADDDESLVLRLQYGQTSVLLVGDAHRRIEKYLVDESPRADLLKVGHHGSATSSTAEFLAAVKPRYAVVSVGLYNPFQHPRREVMQRYAGAGIATYRTDLTGAVSFLLDGSRVTVLPGFR